MSLKSRLLKYRENNSFDSLQEKAELDLLEYIKKNKSIEILSVTAFDKVFAKKNNEIKILPIAFSSKEDYLNEVERICKINDVICEGKVSFSFKDYNVQILFPPIVKNEPLLIISKKKKITFSEYFQNKFISSEMSAYLKECLEKKANIFILGSNSVDKNSILNFLLEISPQNNTNIICDTFDNLVCKNGCNIQITQSALKNISDIKYDNIFCSEVKIDALTNIFNSIISGCNGFCVSLSIKDGIDILAAIRNMILLSNINLFEENADFLTSSAIDVILFAEKDENDNVYIAKISEVIKNKQNNSILKDIFVKGKNGTHISTGNGSKFYNNESTKRFFKDYLEENHIHSYISGITEDIVLPAEKDDKKKRLKDKLKKLKEEKTIKLEEETKSSIENNKNIITDEKTITLDSENLQLENNVADIENVILAEKNEAEINDSQQDFEEIKNDNSDNPFEKSNEIEIQQEVESFIVDNNLDEDSNNGLLASENDDFFEANETLTPKIRNIFEEDDDSSENDYSDEINPEEDVEKLLEQENYFENQKTDVPQDIMEKYSDEQNSQIVEEPELFSEIKEVDVSEYEDDFLEITDEDI